MNEMKFKLPKGMSAEDTAKTFAVYLQGLGAHGGIVQSGAPHRSDNSSDEQRWQLDDANDHWLHVKSDGSARVVSRYSAHTPELLVNLFLERYGDKFKGADAA